MFSRVLANSPRVRVPPFTLIAVFAAVLALLPRPDVATEAAEPAIATRLGDEEFWRLSQDLSEPGGYFRSENLVSNEHTFQHVVPALKRRVRPGGVYLGVAPDQNFTYIVATRPRIAFIIDIRRGNLLQHLMYKAVIELSADRAEFVSRLFSKPRPIGLTAAASAADLFAAYRNVPTSEELYRQNVRTIRDHLVRRRGLVLSPDDLDQIESIYFAFFWDGPSLRYSTRPGFGGRSFGSSFPTYEELMVATDADGVPHGYLASEAHFRILKEMQTRNLIVPVVGDFAGPKAVRAVGRYIRERQATVSAYYVSNVEQYLFQDGLFDAFARNVATLPVDTNSTFIRSVSRRFGYPGLLLGHDGRASALDPIQRFVRDVQAGRVITYSDVNMRSR
jgi:hypothetical protein